MIYFGVFVMALGGMLTVVHVGSMSRQDNGIKHGFSFRNGVEGAEAPGAAGSAAGQEKGLAADFKRGMSVIAGKGGDLTDDLLSWLGVRKESPETRTASMSSSDDSSSGAFDPFEEFYSKYYAKGSPESASYDPGASGASAASFSGAGASNTASSRKAAALSDKNIGGAGAISLKDAEAARPVFGGPLGKRGSRASASSLHASLPSRGGTKAPPALGLGNNSAPVRMRSPGGRDDSAVNKLSGMGGSVSAGDLNDAASGMRSGSQGSYNSAASLDAAGAAAAGAANTKPPKVSTPERVASGSGSSSPGGGSTSSASSSSGNSSSSSSGDNKSVAAPKAPASEKSFTVASAPRDSFLGSVVTERQNRAEGQYLDQEDYKAPPEKSLLVAGAAAVDSEDEASEDSPAVRSAPALSADPGNEGFLMRGFSAREDTGDSREQGAARSFHSRDGHHRYGHHRDGHRRDGHRRFHRGPRTPDPENFAELSAERKKRIRRHIHRFIRRFENRYGMMYDISYTPCEKGKELCVKHDLTKGYITFVTRMDAELVIGLKYIRQRWRPYTVSVTLPHQ